jgi:hypothetical protein
MLLFAVRPYRKPLSTPSATNIETIAELIAAIPIQQRVVL